MRELFVPVRAFQENDDERVKSMCGWALGRIGGSAARKALESFRGSTNGITVEEMEHALTMFP